MPDQTTLAIFNACHLISYSTDMSQIASVAREKVTDSRSSIRFDFDAVTQGRRSDVLSFSESIETEIDIWL